jgi:glucuronate isomerase
LSAASEIDVTSYPKFMEALENRRAFFIRMGAKATDHAAVSAYTEELSPTEAETIFSRR